MPKIRPELQEILSRYGIDPRDASQVWDCHGTLVLYHKAFEIIGAKEGITFDPPIVLEADGTAKSVALCVVAHMGERSEWATGEAAPGNNKNAYPYAMAEKRAKDRAIAKLVGLAAYIYSEDEADDFKNAKPSGAANGADWRLVAEEIKAEIDGAIDAVAVRGILESKAFADLSQHSKKAADFLADRAQKRVGTVMQSNPKKAA